MLRDTRVLDRIAVILAGKRTVAVDTTLRLSRFFVTNQSFWSSLQTDYDTTTAKDTLAEERLSIEAYDDHLALVA